jgi:hypothetical protein
MATPPVFTAGQVLTAAQMNAVGLWLVKTVTIGTGVSSVPVTGAFSADYDNYLVTLSGSSATLSTSLVCQLGSVTSGYRYTFNYTTYSGIPLAIGTTTATGFEYVGAMTTTSAAAYITLQNPFLARNTFCQGSAANTVFAGTVSGILATTDSFTGFTIITGGGTLTGGEIRVYGYRK